MAVVDKIKEINDIRVKLREKIAEKGVDIPENTPFADYVDKVGEISGGGAEPKLQTKVVAVNNTSPTDVRPDDGYDGLSKVNLQVKTLQESKTITENGTYNINEGDYLYNGGSIDVNVSGGGSAIDISESGMKLAYSTFTEVPDAFSGWDKLEDGVRMFTQCKNLKTFKNNLNSLTNGNEMFWDCDSLELWDVELPELTNGDGMFRDCDKLTEWNIELPKLNSTSWMFYYGKLTEWNIELPELTYAYGMFQSCSKLITFKSNLPKLEDGTYMFQSCSALKSFDSKLPVLAKCEGMFNGCSNLETFKSDLYSLIRSYNMFYNCKNLTTFDSDLSSLDSGNVEVTSSSNPAYRMFGNCTSLANVVLKGTLRCSIDFSSCPLTTESIDNIVNVLVSTDIIGVDQTRTLKLGAANIGRMSEFAEELISRKGWKYE